MLPFHVELIPGRSPYRQIVFAATKAVVSGELSAGEAFPSVRDLSQALKINPNTAHKVVSELVQRGMLEVLPGIGTVVSASYRSTSEERRDLLADRVEHLVVDAARLGLVKDDVLDAVEDHWRELFGDDAADGEDVTESRAEAS